MCPIRSFLSVADVENKGFGKKVSQTSLNFGRPVQAGASQRRSKPHRPHLSPTFIVFVYSITSILSGRKNALLTFLFTSAAATLARLNPHEASLSHIQTLSRRSLKLKHSRMQAASKRSSSASPISGRRFAPLLPAINRLAVNPAAAPKNKARPGGKPEFFLLSLC
jgi:hypothetical protein